MKWESECGSGCPKYLASLRLLMAHHQNAPLVTLVTNGAPAGGAPLVVLQKKI